MRHRSKRRRKVPHVRVDASVLYDRDLAMFVATIANAGALTGEIRVAITGDILDMRERQVLADHPTAGAIVAVQQRHLFTAFDAAHRVDPNPEQLDPTTTGIGGWLSSANEPFLPAITAAVSSAGPRQDDIILAANPQRFGWRCINWLTSAEVSVGSLNWLTNRNDVLDMSAMAIAVQEHFTALRTTRSEYRVFLRRHNIEHLDDYLS